MDYVLDGLCKRDGVVSKRILWVNKRVGKEEEDGSDAPCASWWLAVTGAICELVILRMNVVGNEIRLI